MRFMMIVKASKESEQGVMPSEQMLATMGKYNEELQKAGILLELGGLQPSSRAARVRFEGKKRTFVDGPFTETKELIAGFWIIQVKSREEAFEWARRIPFESGEEVELRPFFDMDDFAPGPAVDAAKKLGEELAARKR